jgi:SAM-dependent methyltransferase
VSANIDTRKGALSRNRKRTDAFGRALWDQYHGGGKPAIIEREDGMIEADLLHQYFAAYGKWHSVEKKALRYVRGRVLDIGCGAGRHALFLQAKGHRVTAMDSSPLAVAVSRKRGVKDARVLAVSSLRTLAPTRFDSVVMLGNNLGLLGSLRRGRTLLRQLDRLTVAGARIIGTMVDPYMTRDPDHLAYHRRNRRRGRMSGQLRLRIRYGKLATPWFDYLFVSKEELERILTATGWHITVHFSSGGGP